MITTGSISAGLNNGKTGLALCKMSHGHLSYKYVLLESTDSDDL